MAPALNGVPRARTMAAVEITKTTMVTPVTIRVMRCGDWKHSAGTRTQRGVMRTRAVRQVRQSDVGTGSGSLADVLTT